MISAPLKVSDLHGELLDYYVARAEGIPAAHLELRGQGNMCCRIIDDLNHKIYPVELIDYSTNWELTGPLLEKHGLELLTGNEWSAHQLGHNWGEGQTPLIAI